MKPSWTIQFPSSKLLKLVTLAQNLSLNIVIAFYLAQICSHASLTNVIEHFPPSVDHYFHQSLPKSIVNHCICILTSSNMITFHHGERNRSISMSNAQTFHILYAKFISHHARVYDFHSKINLFHRTKEKPSQFLHRYVFISFTLC